MKIAYIASFPPRECGIATFTQNLMRSIGGNLHTDDSSGHTTVIAVNDTGMEYSYGPEVGFTITQERQEDYYNAAGFIHNSGAQVCILQHEFGIFGGESGAYILSLLNSLRIPFIVTFHTILKEPTWLQKIIIQKIAQNAAAIVVMSHKAITFLGNIYEISTEKIHLIEHGVPDMIPENLLPSENLLQPYQNRRILFTFGLLNRNKGIETVIRALPKIMTSHPEVVYIVLGNTHPGVIRTSGEEYRDYLKQFADELEVGNCVHFIDRFVTEAQLAYYLAHVDIYISPYLNEAQITSGTLSYAIGAGAAVLSTPYWHAQELLENGRGILFGFKDSNQLAEKINGLLNFPNHLDALRKRAQEYGQRMKWSRSGKKYLQILQHIVEENMLIPVNNTFSVIHLPSLPPFDLSHVLRLTDSTGIIQHAKYGIPNLKEGYCLDDNARALILGIMAYRRYKSPEILQLLPVYLSFIHYMQRKEGLFRNFLDFSREFKEDVGSEDAFGRAIWAIGYLVRYAPNSAYREAALEIFRQAEPHFTSLHHLRGIANTIIGICHYLCCFPTDEGLLGFLSVLSRKLTDAFRLHASETWQWFEEKMNYDNGILPLALLHAYEITEEDYSKKVAFNSLQFLEKTCFRKEWFTPVGNQGWYVQGGSIPLFDQQAIETMAMVLAYNEAYHITRKPSWLHKMYKCHAWFLGENELHIPLFDWETCGCCDGLQEGRINRNQGAESTLAYWISHLTVTKAMESGFGLNLQLPLPSQEEAIL